MELVGVASAAVSGVYQFTNNVDQISRSIGTTRNVTIQITNNSNIYILTNPKTDMTSGYCLLPPQPTIATGTERTCSFSKTPNTIFGVEGILTYQILKDGREYADLFIRFLVPFKYTFHKNKLAVGILDKKTKYDSKFYKQHKGSDLFERETGTGSCIIYDKDKEVIVKGTMSAGGAAVMKVELWDK